MKRTFCIFLLLATFRFLAYTQPLLPLAYYENNVANLKNSASGIFPVHTHHSVPLPEVVMDSFKNDSDIISKRTLPVATPESQGINGLQMTKDIDSIANPGIREMAYPDVWYW